MSYKIDLPNPHNLEGFWVEIATFDDRDKAIAYLKQTFGADDEGNINLLTELEETEEDQTCEYCDCELGTDRVSKTNADEPNINEDLTLQFCDDDCFTSWTADISP